MRQILVSIIALFASILLFASGNTMLGTLSSLRLASEGFSTTTIGPILACYAVGFVAGSLYAGSAIRSVGHIRSASVFAAIAGSAALVHPMTDSAPVWALARGVVGFCVAGLMVVIESWVNDRATNDNRGALFSFYQVAFYLASLAGQALVATGEPETSEPFSFTAILVTLALVPLALTRRGTPPVEQSERLSLVRLYGISPVGLSAAFLSGIILSAFSTMAPAYGKLLGLSTAQVAIFMSVSVLGATLLAWPSGHLSDRFDRRYMLVFAGLVASASAFGIAMLGADIQLGVLVLVGTFMGFAATLYPLSVAVVNDRLHSEQMVAASGGLLFSHGLGTTVGPVGGSLAMTQAGPMGLFLFLGTVASVLALFVLGRILRTPAISVEDQEEFIWAAPSSTAVIAELDPRNEDFPDGDDSAQDSG